MSLDKIIRDNALREVEGRMGKDLPADRSEVARFVGSRMQPGLRAKERGAAKRARGLLGISKGKDAPGASAWTSYDIEAFCNAMSIPYARLLSYSSAAELDDLDWTRLLTMMVMRPVRPEAVEEIRSSLQALMERPELLEVASRLAAVLLDSKDKDEATLRGIQVLSSADNSAFQPPTKKKTRRKT